jgi:hypothetical protein
MALNGPIRRHASIDLRAAASRSLEPLNDPKTTVVSQGWLELKAA